MKLHDNGAPFVYRKKDGWLLRVKPDGQFVEMQRKLKSPTCTTCGQGWVHTGHVNVHGTPVLYNPELELSNTDYDALLTIVPVYSAGEFK